MKTQTISVNQLKTLLATVNHATPIAFTALTDARALKSCPWGSVSKWTRISAFTGADYSSSVERQRQREGTAFPEGYAFQAQPRKWGTRISSALVGNPDKETGKMAYYLPAQIQRAAKPLYLVKKGRHLTAVSKALIAAYLPKDRSEQTAVAQNVERPVVYRDYRLDSITQISIGGKKYRVRS